MSRLWPERLSIGFAPDVVEYELVSPRWRQRRVLLKGAVKVAEIGQERWRGSLMALSGVVASNMAKGATSTVFLSCHFVRCELLPWNDQLTAVREYKALARAKFRAIHGAVTDGWDIRLGAMNFGKPVLAFAVDAALILEIEKVLTGAGTILSSVQPNFCAAFDRHRKRFAAGTAWFGLLEPGRLWLACVVDGIWRHVTSRVIGNDPSAEMLSACAQERALLARQDSLGSTVVHAVVTGFDREVVHALRSAGVNILGSEFPGRFDVQAGVQVAA